MAPGEEEAIKGVLPSEILNVCKSCLGNAWSSVSQDDVDIQVQPQGYSNRLFVCSLKNTVSGDDGLKPRTVLVRYYGGSLMPESSDNPAKCLTIAGEVLLFYVRGEMQLGPKLLGVFNGGRVEQFIPSRNLTVNEFTGDKQVLATVARQMAQYHVTDIPVKKTPWPLEKMIVDSYRSFEKRQESLPEPFSAQHAEARPRIIAFDFIAEVEWIGKVLRRLNSRIVFAHNDLSRSNILVAKDDDQISDRFIIVDYEYSGCNYRGMDIGNYFGMFVFDYGSEKFLTKKDYPDEPLRRHFVENYLDECKRLCTFPNWDEGGRDSVDSVLLEAEFFAIVRRLADLSGFLRNIDSFSNLGARRTQADPEFAEAKWPECFLEFYLTRKELLLTNHPELL